MTPTASREAKGRKGNAGSDGQKTVASSGSSSSAPQHDEIAARAHQIYLKKGCPAGRDLENWLEAEQELRREKR